MRGDKETRDDDVENNAAQLARALQWTLGLEPDVQLQVEQSIGLSAHGSSPMRSGRRLYEVDHSETEAEMGKAFFAWL